MPLESCEHDAALMRLVAVLKQETEHVATVAPAAICHIGRIPELHPELAP